MTKYKGVIQQARERAEEAQKSRDILYNSLTGQEKKEIEIRSDERKKQYKISNLKITI